MQIFPLLQKGSMGYHQSQWLIRSDLISLNYADTFPAKSNSLQRGFQDR